MGRSFMDSWVLAVFPLMLIAQRPRAAFRLLTCSIMALSKERCQRLVEYASTAPLPLPVELDLPWSDGIMAL